MVVHGWDARLRQPQGPVPGWSSSRSPVGTCFPGEPLWEQSFWRSDYCKEAGVYREEHGWITELGCHVKCTHTNREEAWRPKPVIPGLRRLTRGSLYFTWAELVSPLLSDGSCLKNEAEGLASWLSVTAIAGKSDKGTSSHKTSSGLRMYPCIHLHINKQQTFNNNKLRSLV